MLAVLEYALLALVIALKDAVVILRMVFVEVAVAGAVIKVNVEEVLDAVGDKSFNGAGRAVLYLLLGLFVNTSNIPLPESLNGNIY